MRAPDAMSAPAALSRLDTRGGSVTFPAYVPVTTFGARFPLDDLIRPYLRRLAPAVMCSVYYARQMESSQHPGVPLFIDSGGFAAGFRDATVEERRGLGFVRRCNDEVVTEHHPREVLELQEALAEVAFTLDFPIPASCELGRFEAEKRQALTVANAFWALENRRRADLRLFACVQGWDVSSARDCAKQLARGDFDGFAIGGLVPRARDTELVMSWVCAVREVLPEKPLHVFGLGEPSLVSALFERGVQSVDSSSFVRLAADGRLWGSDRRISAPSPHERLHLALCNLASATGRALPLSTAPLMFRTCATGDERNRAQ